VQKRFFIACIVSFEKQADGYRRLRQTRRKLLRVPLHEAQSLEPPALFQLLLAGLDERSVMPSVVFT